MTIDELLMRLEYNEHVLTREYKAAKSMLDELRWYREQDLVRREDVVVAINMTNELDARFYRIVNEIIRIPKAEPPHATVDERNGDCETCKHYTDATMYDCANDCRYEPYIPR